MDLYVIRRRGVWADQKELEATSAVSARVGDEMSGRVRWIRSYVVSEADGRLGSVCLYEGSNPEAIREHGRRIRAPADEMQVVTATAIVRDDPQPRAS
jgi:hypothetical protein